MPALEILVKLIRDSEGCELTAYQCPAGVWTIGWGYTGNDIKKGLVWTQEKADECLLVIAMKTIDYALNASPILKTASPSKQAAIADFIYNLGIGNYKSSTLKKKVDEGRWSEAFTEIQRWNKCGGKVLKGLTVRRNKEATLLLL
jgi:lysozyme